MSTKKEEESIRICIIDMERATSRKLNIETSNVLELLRIIIHRVGSASPSPPCKCFAL